MACRSTKPLQWGANFTVGHAGIDAQHRRLVDLINGIEAATHAKESPERRLELLKTLREAAAEHMRQENVILWEIRSGSYAPLQGKGGTPYFVRAMAEAAFDEHMAEHGAILAELDAISHAPDDALCEEIKSWFILHAIKHDSGLKAIFQAI